jgi:hypothetical protein
MLAIDFTPKKMAELRKKGYLAGIKVTVGKRFLFFWKNIDVYQSQDHGKIGCMGDKGEWRKDTVFTRTHLTLGRLRWTVRTAYVPDVRIIG